MHMYSTFKIYPTCTEVRVRQYVSAEVTYLEIGVGPGQMEHNVAVS